jgi:hypothetical protein
LLVVTPFFLGLRPMVILSQACNIARHTNAAIWLANDIFWQSTIARTWHQHFWCVEMKCNFLFVCQTRNRTLHWKFLARHFLTRDIKMTKRVLSLARHDEWG